VAETCSLHFTVCNICQQYSFPKIVNFSRTFVCISRMKHQFDATLCSFYFCRVALHVSGASAHHQEYLKLVQRPLVHVLSLQVSHHNSLLGTKALIRRCDDLPTTITHVPVAAVLVLNTPDDGRLRPKHVE